MARYDIHCVEPDSGFLLDIQSDLLEDLNTRVVVPLMPVERAPKAAAKLNPVFDIDGARYVMATQFLASVPVSILQSPTDNFARHHEEIVSAIDMLTQGY